RAIGKSARPAPPRLRTVVDAPWKHPKIGRPAQRITHASEPMNPRPISRPTPAARRLALAAALPAALLLVQIGVLIGLPQVSRDAAYVFMAVAPLLAALGCAWRARRETASGRVAWGAMAVSLALWSLGAVDNFVQEVLNGHSYEMYRAAMLAFNLANVPIAFLLAGEWSVEGRGLTRAIDALIAVALGYGYFLLVWAMLNARGAPEESGVNMLVWLLDGQNLFVAAGALVRCIAARDTRERGFFGALAAYLFTYTAIVALNNRVLAFHPVYSAQLGSIVSIAFAALWACANGAPREPRPTGVRPGVARAVRSASPVILASALLILALALIRVEYVAGAAGVLIAVFGYALRNIAAQMRHIKREDELQRDRNALEAIASTDALTGVANRRELDRALANVARRRRRRERQAPVAYALLMIDIDHFKLLNDRYGHPAGDACLRVVAQMLQ
ncbi:MAG: GGDEF domain-containing protein, partial [Stenotrophomonas sp.]|nr:GGDEF domain-containing protein [Stenotrophomonas sp.]